MNVLLVDDQEIIIDSVKKGVRWELLPVEEIYTATSSLEAKLIFTNFEVDLLITDIEMPLMDGHRLTKLIKEDDELKKIPVVIFSSLVNEEMRRKGEALGADAQLTKPEIGHLVEAIDRLIDQSR